MTMLQVSQYLTRKGNSAMDQECAERKVYLRSQRYYIICENMLTDIPVQDFKNCFEQWPMCWEYCKELERDYFENF
jgi:hypothetical protein